MKKIFGDAYKQLNIQDTLKAAFRAAVAVLMVFVAATISKWMSDPDSFPGLDMIRLITTLKLAAVVFLSSLVGSYYTNSKGEFMKKDSNTDQKP